MKRQSNGHHNGFADHTDDHTAEEFHPHRRRSYTFSGFRKSHPRLISCMYKISLYIFLPVSLAALSWYLMGHDREKVVCHRDFSQGEALVCRPRCQLREFSLEWMGECRPWLTCQDIQNSDDFKVGKVIGFGAVKVVHEAEWRGYQVAYNVMVHTQHKEDFRHGLHMLASLQGWPYVTQLIGYCRDSYVTQFHPLGSASQLAALLGTPLFQPYKTLKNCFNLCVSYVKILSFLHTSPMGTLVMCDSNDLEKTLEQYLLTPDLQLIANDLDALPEVNSSAGRLIKCGHRALKGDFVAPEQVWALGLDEFKDSEMSPYDEKTDIWKVPMVCDHFLGLAPSSDSIRFRLFKIHNLCKSEYPSSRPTAGQILEEYLRVKEEMDL